ncbi:hypothetical protein TNIN_401201 [Trichonephila inaurata madagascariensis]|uniref:Uncharacterized protein n=1 Tax=Trichonephila inaurata madagascariensis TaxID=2747483 RepID=A0A8X6WR46_9ARAC|nr:hypothetical protein TNIN_401201 [Trichonephila inaurata madagascariensis]
MSSAETNLLSLTAFVIDEHPKNLGWAQCERSKNNSRVYSRFDRKSWEYQRRQIATRIAHHFGSPKSTCLSFFYSKHLKHTYVEDVGKLRVSSFAETSETYFVT